MREKSLNCTELSANVQINGIIKTKRQASRNCNASVREKQKETEIAKNDKEIHADDKVNIRLHANETLSTLICVNGALARVTGEVMSTSVASDKDDTVTDNNIEKLYDETRVFRIRRDESAKSVTSAKNRNVCEKTITAGASVVSNDKPIAIRKRLSTCWR